MRSKDSQTPSKLGFSNLLPRHQLRLLKRRILDTTSEDYFGSFFNMYEVCIDQQKSLLRGRLRGAVLDEISLGRGC